MSNQEMFLIKALNCEVSPGFSGLHPPESWKLPRIEIVPTLLETCSYAYATWKTLNHIFSDYFKYHKQSDNWRRTFLLVLEKGIVGKGRTRPGWITSKCSSPYQYTRNCRWRSGGLKQGGKSFHWIPNSGQNHYTNHPILPVKVVSYQRNWWKKCGWKATARGG